MTCHAQASTDENGNPGFGASLGASWRLNLFGFAQVEMRSPDLGWFFYPGTAQPFVAVQDDFVWGILNAQCVEAGANGLCESYPDSPTIIE